MYQPYPTEKTDKSYEQIKWEKEYLLKANIPHRHKKGDVKPEQATTMGDVTSKLATGCIIALLGTRGGGKTWLSCEAIRHSILVLARSGQYCKAMEFFMDVKATYKDKAPLAEREVVAEYTKPYLLVIDEIGERSESDWENRLLIHLIDKRYDAMKDTILIGNFTRENFIKNVGSSIASRMTESGGVIECNWESMR